MLATLPLEKGVPMPDKLTAWPAAIRNFGASRDSNYNAVCIRSTAKYLDDKRPQYRATACELLAHSFPYQMVEEGLLPRIGALPGRLGADVPQVGDRFTSAKKQAFYPAAEG